MTPTNWICGRCRAEVSNTGFRPDDWTWNEQAALHLCGSCSKIFSTAAENKVDHPSHYGGDVTYEHVKVAEAWGLDKDAHLYNCTKYICRVGKKGGATVLEDLRKAAWYLARRIEKEEAVCKTVK